MQQLVIIEGNISAGKSTLTRELAASLGYRVFLEPTSTNPFLALFYQDPKKYALRMQVYLLRRRFHTYIAAVQHMLETGQGAVLDRSIFSDWVFAEKNRIDGNIDADGFFYYSRLRDQMLEQLPFPHVTVYLDVPAKQCHERIHGMRMRAAEVDTGIPLEYLEGLERCYEEFLGHMKERGSRVVSLDWSGFGTAGAIKQAVQAATAAAQLWDTHTLRHILSSPLQIKARVRGPRGMANVSQDDSDDEALARVDLESSNSEEMLAVGKPLTAPSSPQQSAD